MIKIAGKMAMAVLPATYNIDFESLKEIFGTRNESLATEYEFKNRFPDCELGAMPPFGNLYDMEVYVAESLTLDKEIAFSAGSPNELIRLSYADYKRLVKPRIFKFTWKLVSICNKLKPLRILTIQGRSEATFNIIAQPFQINLIF